MSEKKLIWFHNGWGDVVAVDPGYIASHVDPDVYRLKDERRKWQATLCNSDSCEVKANIGQFDSLSAAIGACEIHAGCAVMDPASAGTMAVIDNALQSLRALAFVFAKSPNKSAADVVASQSSAKS